jgi:exodeoxyribonuclease-5
MHQLTKEQIAVVKQLKQWWRYRTSADIKIGGLAGTGKTELIANLSKYLRFNSGDVAYCAYTGKAAQVLSERLRFGKAMTIHRLIYQPIDQHCEECPRRDYQEDLRRPGEEEPRCHNSRCDGCSTKFVLRETLPEWMRLVIVDEASMVNEGIYNDLMQLGVPVIWVGDHGQLPPVEGRSIFHAPDHVLKTPLRTGPGSDILRLALDVRAGRSIELGRTTETHVHHDDGEMAITDDWDDQLILCFDNERRISINRAVREMRGFDEIPEAGDRVVCLRNNYETMVFNGEQGTVLDIDTSYRTDKNGNTALATIEMDNGRRYQEVISLEAFHSHPADARTIPKRHDIWDYGYCLTVHKAQGSEAARCVLFERLFWRGERRRRWLYTGVTRAKRHLEVIK